MKYAIADGGHRKEAMVSGERGKCLCCGSETIAYCGAIQINHWKHKALVECDPWQENETEWHRKWKEAFPESYHEVVMFDQISGEKHVADIFIPGIKLTIEFQHSPLEPNEITSREAFYKK